MKFSHNRSFVSVFFVLLALDVLGQSIGKLSGDIIGTTLSVDYNTNTQSTTINTKENVFDGDYNTFFASYDRSNTWVGLDLGTPHIITKVGWSPRNSDKGPQRCQLAIIEGANDPNFGDAVPLYIISDITGANVMHYQDINVNKGFRYVRYVGPNDARCNLAELAFYGYDGEGDDSKYYQLTNLPTVSIHTSSGENPLVKGEDFDANITIIYNDGSLIQQYPIQVRVRGNGSADAPKKPYRIKLVGKSRHLLKDSALESPAKAKKWTLLSNYTDKSLMRNLLAFELSRRLQSSYTVWGHPVDVIMNGEYQGCYQLCDQVTIDPNRVPITEMTSDDIESPNVTGGYLVEVDAYAFGEAPMSWFTSNRGIPVTIKEPDEDDIVPEQYNYIKNFFNKMEASVFSYDYTSYETGFRNMLDINSFLKHFLVGEFSGNTDTYWSVYMYKDRNEDVFHVAPCWDFDLAFENDSRTYPINDHDDWVYKKASAAGNMKDLVTRILSDPNTIKELQEMWRDMRESETFSEEALTVYIDSMARVLDKSQTLNFIRWNNLSTIVPMNPRAPKTYAEEIEFIKDYIKNRLGWMDEKMMHLSDMVTEEKQPANVYDISGRLIRKSTPSNTNLQGLSPGFYIVNGVKVVL